MTLTLRAEKKSWRLLNPFMTTQNQQHPQQQQHQQQQQQQQQL